MYHNGQSSRLLNTDMYADCGLWISCKWWMKFIVCIQKKWNSSVIHCDFSIVLALDRLLCCQFRLIYCHMGKNNKKKQNKSRSDESYFSILFSEKKMLLFSMYRDLAEYWNNNSKKFFPPNSCHFYFLILLTSSLAFLRKFPCIPLQQRQECRHSFSYGTQYSSFTFKVVKDKMFEHE